MNKLIQNREVGPGVRVHSEKVPGRATLWTKEYSDAVACLYGIIKLSPPIAHRIMKKIIGIYRHLALVSEKPWKDY
jgi:hypothetical protein